MGFAGGAGKRSVGRAETPGHHLIPCDCVNANGRPSRPGSPYLRAASYAVAAVVTIWLAASRPMATCAPLTSTIRSPAMPETTLI